MIGGADSILKTLLDDCADAFISLVKNTSQTGVQVVVGKLTQHCILRAADASDSGVVAGRR